MQGQQINTASLSPEDVVYLFCHIQISQKENQMSYKIMFVLTAIVSLAFGIGYLVVPAMVLGFFGTEKTVPVQIVARFFGSALFALGLVLWFAKDIADAKIQQNLGYGLLVSNVIGLVLAIYGATSVIRNNSWIPMLVYVLLGLGYAFLLFLRPRMKE
jgi:hypothetical protein